MNKVIKNNRRPGTSDQSLFRLQTKFIKIFLLVIYYLSKFEGAIQSGFGVIPKITLANLCKPIHDVTNYSTSICHFESEKCGKEEEKQYKNWNILRTKRAF